MVKNFLDKTTFVDTLIACIYIHFVFESTWASAACLISVIALKGFTLYFVKPDKKDDIGNLQEQIRKVQEQVTGMNLKLFGQRKV